MKASVYFPAILTVCSLLVIGSSSAPTTQGVAFTTLTVKPSLIDVNLTESMLVECSLDDTAHIVSHIVSIVILRKGKNNNKNVLVASVTSFDPAKAVLDYGSLAVFGSVELSRNHLRLVWDHPGADQASNYTCEINAIDGFARPITLLASYTVNSRVPTIEVIISHIRDLERRADTLEQILGTQNQRLAKLELQAAGANPQNTTGRP